MASSLEIQNEELRAFDETKAGVKGIVDGGIKTVPAIFHTPAAERDADESPPTAPLPHPPLVPIIDISAEDAAGKIRLAAETWGLFQVLNHGVPPHVLAEMLAGIRRFNEQDPAEKSLFYARDQSRRVRYNSTFDLYQSQRANWRDTLICELAPHPIPPHELPATCGDIIVEYSRHVAQLGEALLELLAEALGLRRSYLKELHCVEGQMLVCHYYPPCPQPELTLGTSSHSDAGFLTVLLQDDVGGLQVRYQGRWVDVPPVPGALIVNIADLMQVITNDRFKSGDHRVVATKRGPRISVATFFIPYSFFENDRSYGPIEELLAEDSPPRYRKITVQEYSNFYNSKGLSQKDKLAHFTV